MPDIRSFFGGKPPADDEKPPAKPEAGKTKGRKSRTIVMDDSDDSDDDVILSSKKPTSKAGPQKKSQPEQPSKGKETTSADYFGSSTKPKRSEAAKSKHAAISSATAVADSPRTAKNGTAVATRPKKSPKARIAVFEDPPDNDDDIFSADYKKSGRLRGDDYEEGTDEDDDDDIVVVQPTRPAAKKSRRGKTEVEDDGDDGDDDFDPAPEKPEDTKANKKRKSDDLEDNNATPKKGGRGKKAAATPASSKKAKKAAVDEHEDPEMQAIYNSITTVRAPTPPPRGADGKWDFVRGGGNIAPPGAGSKEIPEGAENCLAGLCFVFTGVNATLDRDEGQRLVKRHGGKVVTAPSKNTDYVVLGTGAGPKKLETIRTHNIKTIDEDGLFELIRKLPAGGGSGKAAKKDAAKQQKEQEKVTKLAAQMTTTPGPKRGGGGGGGGVSGKSDEGPAVEDQLWTVKYAPTQIKDICGNKGLVEKLRIWLENFPKNLKTNFKLAGKEGSGTYRAALISGPPGIGKTTAAHVVAKSVGYDIVEMNASDTRSKKLLEQGLKGVLGTTSLLGYFAGDGEKVDPSKKKLVLIMDEVDGMSAGDRGGVGALAAVCKKTHIPLILICNEKGSSKMKPFQHVTYDLPFRRPTADMIRARMMTICFREELKIPGSVIDALVKGSNNDIRQVVNMISSVKLDQDTMDYSTGTKMADQWEKHVTLKPFDIAAKILGGSMFAPSSKTTLSDKIELYFNDHDISYLMLQENYMGTDPMLSNSYDGREKRLKNLELISKAADSISDGDLVDRMIHGSQQHWTLMPTHAVFGFVRPASFVAGNIAGNQPAFASWLGRNSTQQRLTRLVKEIQGHMRLRSSGDRHEVRQQYVPLLWRLLADRLSKEGKDAVPGIIGLMDSYFLTKDDFDAIQELGVGIMKMEKNKIDSAAKAAFTRLYNLQSHPLPFMKASSVGQPKQNTKVKPDLEEAMEASDDDEVMGEVADTDDDDDTNLTKDRYIKAPKKKKKAAAASAKAKGIKGVKREPQSDDEDEAPPPKKGKGAGGKARARGKGVK